MIANCRWAATRGVPALRVAVEKRGGPRRPRSQEIIYDVSVLTGEYINASRHITRSLIQSLPVVNVCLCLAIVI